VLVGLIVIWGGEMMSARGASSGMPSPAVLAELLQGCPLYLPTIDIPSSNLSLLLTPSVRTKHSSELYPKLQNDAFFVLRRDGAVIRCDQQGLFLRGDRLWELLTYLSPWFNGVLDLEQLCSSLEPDLKERLDALVRLLIESGVLRTVAPESEVTAALRNRFAAQLEIAEHWSGSGMASFQRFRRSAVLLVGSGLSFGTCASSLFRCGLRNLCTLNVEGKDQLKSARNVASELNATGVETLLEEVDRRAFTAEFKPPSFDVIAYCSDKAFVGDILMINRACCQVNSVFVPGLVAGGMAFMGPKILPSYQGCWLCSILRVLDGRRQGGATQPSTVDCRCAISCFFSTPRV
jgi:hypothetical protein